MESGWKRGIDFLLYVGIALAVLGIVVATAIYTAHHHLDNDRPLVWVGFVIMTGILFGWLIRNQWAYRKLGRLWLSLAFLLAAHLATGALQVGRIQNVKLVWLVIIGIPEFQLMNTLLKLVLRTKSNKNPTRIQQEIKNQNGIEDRHRNSQIS